MKTFSLFISLVVALAALTFAVPAQAARVALVIGNAAYSEGPLKNPVNDARAMDQKLTSLGFKVQRIENLKRQQIGRTLTAFGSAIRAGDEVVVFYAGHGLQVKGVNYLPAVDADIQSEDDVPLNSLNLNALMDWLDEAKAGLKLLFLDACRNNPYARSFRGGDRGLARLGEAPSGTLIHFATRPGRVAADGTGSNGLYTSQLIRYIDEPNTPVETMLKRVSAAVESASKGQQEPWTEGSIKGEFFFKPGTGVQMASIQPEPVVQVAPRVAPAQFTAGESVKDCAECPEMVVIPGGRFTMGSGTAEQALAIEGRLTKDWTDRESPQHIVNIKSFAAGKYAVTKGEFAAFVNAKGYQTEAEKGDGCYAYKDNKWQKDQSINWRNVGFTQGDDHPVVCVSWNDAKAYAQWVSQVSGKAYRLLSEAEREYAARAGSQHAFWWGENIATGQANYKGNSHYNGSPKGEYRQATVPVNTFSPNGYGLYNVHGNVWDWVEDCIHDNYSGAPTDGSA